ncbi:CsbD family protein [Gordonia sp. (in: high G+C Gram-positive bacteria)]|uniref:CsbD family protein n=1 Tax=unclassified Gordonia (in: high G+C Gram-positive bacteria) TaxID=2657482 RepID=UPI002616A8A7|nr:CsbD family protein [Gordonia sp. (in: high G+C Gram-positive bacteria)]
MNDKSGAMAGIKGVVDGVKGKAKEVAGNAVGNDDLAAEGRRERAEAGAERDIAKHEAQAEQARTEAHLRENG